ncbi:hypothetical protein [Nocardia gamkensis]|uniref:Uncharacterized protein n=1 Tax=Nocardia gamkensis TaxID=352869 RepID=A0A7X6L4V3_9NOCA|nr:hypothetical protein [Nocardia gamkensis]NKY27737.1 hypothetical protein [Nocardia gamkensis]NQE67374.1 hypothetical protein [Nocardia gamkensis]
MTDANHSADPDRTLDSPIGAHLLSISLDVVNELVAELLETAEQHRTVAPQRAAQMAVLAIVLMEQTNIWLRQVARA